MNNEVLTEIITRLENIERMSSELIMWRDNVACAASGGKGIFFSDVESRVRQYRETCVELKKRLPALIEAVRHSRDHLGSHAGDETLELLMWLKNEEIKKL